MLYNATVVILQWSGADVVSSHVNLALLSHNDPLIFSVPCGAASFIILFAFLLNTHFFFFASNLDSNGSLIKKIHSFKKISE